MRAVRYPAGQSPSLTAPGDLILTHRRAWPSRFIAFGQSLRFRGNDRKYAHYTHVAIAVNHGGSLVEALGHGVECTHIERYRDVEYRYVHIDADYHDREQMVRFALACVGRPYGWGDIVALGLTLLTGSRFVFGNPGTLICSGLAAEALSRGDFIWPRDPAYMAPADIAAHLNVTL